MITREIVDGEEYFAVDGHCERCAFILGTAPCLRANCRPYERNDTRSVHFQPLNDVRTTMAYAIQEDMKGQVTA